MVIKELVFTTSDLEENAKDTHEPEKPKPWVVVVSEVYFPILSGFPRSTYSPKEPTELPDDLRFFLEGFAGKIGITNPNFLTEVYRYLPETITPYLETVAGQRQVLRLALSGGSILRQAFQYILSFVDPATLSDTRPLVESYAQALAAGHVPESIVRFVERLGELPAGDSRVVLDVTPGGRVNTMTIEDQVRFQGIGHSDASAV